MRCNICEHRWKVRLNDVINNDVGCPSCAGLIKLTNTSVDRLLKEQKRNITRIGDIINARTKIEWKCSNNHSWSTTPDSVLNLLSGCPMCNRVGHASKEYFKRNPHKKKAPGLLYLIQLTYNNQIFVKVGITENNVTRRFAGDIQRYKIKEIASKQMSLYDAFLIEQEILNCYVKYLAKPSSTFGGKTECMQIAQDNVQLIIDSYFK